MKKQKTLQANLRAACAALLTVGALQTARADYQADILSQGPVGYWRLNETTAPTAPPPAPNLGTNGASANGEYLDGVLRGAPGAIASEPGNLAIRVNGDEKNRVRIPYAPEWNVNGPFSVEFWAKPAQTAIATSPGASTTFTSTTRSGWLFYQGDTSIATGNGWYFRLYRGASATATRNAAVNMNLDVNKWYHVVGVFDGTNVKLYVDGLSVANVALADTYRTVTDTTAPMTFGARSDGAGSFTYFPFVGNVDEPAFYTKALSDAQILAHYQAGTNATPATPYDQVILADGPAGYWRLSEPAAPSAANLGTLADGSGTYVHPVTVGQAGPTTAGFAADNKAISVDSASGGYVQLPPLNLYSDTATITAWVKANGAQEAYAGIVTHDDLAATISGINVGPTGGRSLGYTWANAAETYDWQSGLNLPDNQWAFVALAVSPDSATLALHDGVSFQSTNNPFPNPPQPFSASTRVGNDALGPQYTFKGSIDEVAIFDRTLSLGELYSQWASAVGGVGPRIFAQPQAPAAIYEQETLVLSVDAGGTPALGYQWRRGGNPIDGETSPVFTKGPLAMGDSGTYNVVITNASGSVTSDPVVISVQQLTAPAITQQPVGTTIYEGGTINLSVTATGGSLRYQWRLGTTNIDGATSATFVVANATGADAGSYTVVITNSLNSITSAPAVVNVIVPAADSFEDAIVAAGPQAWWRLDDAPGSTVMADAMGRHPGSYRGTLTLGVTGAIATSGAANKGVEFNGNADNFGEVPFSPILNSPDFTVEAWARVSNIGETLTVFSSWTDGAKGHWMYADGGGTWRGGVGSGGVNYYVPGPSGDDIVAANEWVHLALINAPSGVRFYVNGVYDGVNYADFDRNNSAPIIIGGAPAGLSSQSPFKGVIDEVAIYTRALTQAELQEHVQAALYGNNTAPVFLTQPQSRTVGINQTARLIAKVGGTAPISYQWLKGTSEIQNATNATLNLPNVSTADNGNYQLKAWNAVGTNLSDVATLTVVPLPTEVILTNELVLHLKFEGNPSDSSGRGNNGTQVGVAAYVPGAVGTQGFKFSTEVTAGNVSAANYINLGTPADLNFGTDVDFSVSYWVRMTNSPGDLPIFCNADGSFTNPGFTFAPSYEGGGWSWGLGSAGVYGEDDSINDGEWHHVLHTFDRTGNGVTYLDGLQVDSRPAVAGGDVWTGRPVTVGQDPSGEYPEAAVIEVDDLGVWRRILDPFEAFSVYWVGKTYKLSFDEKNPAVTMTVAKVGAELEISWSNGTLQESSTVTGGWTAVTGATAPTYRVTPGPGSKFYRVQVSP